MFKLWSANKIKTFKTEEELHVFVKEKKIWDFVVLYLIKDESSEGTIKIQIKDEIKGWVTDAYLFLHQDNTWSWTEDFHNGSKTNEKVNDTLKDYVDKRRRQPVEENARYSVYDVYSPSELGLSIQD